MNKDNANFLLRKAKEAGITDPKELANFMGQMQVESGGFRSKEESLAYTPKRLLQVFHGRNGIDDVHVAERIVAGGLESVANAIYGGTWGIGRLGNTKPGDGYEFRGRGFVQLTGRERYEEAAAMTGLDLVNQPELAAQRDNAASIAIAYWKAFVVAHHAQQDTKRACFYINGGYNGLEERRRAVTAWEHRLAQGHKPGNPEPGRSLERGMVGKDVQQLQEGLSRLGYTDDHGRALQGDGRFGPATLEAVVAFQHDRGLRQDGVAGATTQRQLHAALKGGPDATVVPGDTRPPAATSSATDLQPGHHSASPMLPAEPASNLTGQLPDHLIDFRHPEHPMHARYRDALGHVHAMEQRGGLGHGSHSERLAAFLTDALAAHDIGRDGLDRFGPLASVDLRGQGKDMRVVATERRVNYYLVAAEVSLPVEQGMAGTVEEISRGWSRRHVPSLRESPAGARENAPARELEVQQASAQGSPPRSEDATDRTLRSHIAVAYARFGVERDDGQLDQATAAVALAARKAGMDLSRPTQVFLREDQRTGMAGPDSGLLVRQPQTVGQPSLAVDVAGLSRGPDGPWEQPARLDGQQVQPQPAPAQPAGVVLQ